MLISPALSVGALDCCFSSTGGRMGRAACTLLTHNHAAAAAIIAAIMPRRMAGCGLWKDRGRCLQVDRPEPRNVLSGRKTTGCSNEQNREREVSSAPAARGNSGASTRELGQRSKGTGRSEHTRHPCIRRAFHARPQTEPSVSGVSKSVSQTHLRRAESQSAFPQNQYALVFGT